MKHIYLILAFLLASCAAPTDETYIQEECCMPSPLDEFSNSPRRLRNDNGSEVVSSSLVKLGPGIIASRQTGAPGEATFATIDAPGVAALQAQITALTARVAALEAIVATVSIAATGSTIAKRNIDGELLAVNFRGDLRATSDSDAIEIKTNDNQVVAAFGLDSGFPALKFFSAGPLAIKGSLSASSPTLAADLAATLQGYGLIDLVP